MFRHLILPILAVLGIACGIYAAVRSAHVQSASLPLAPPASSPYSVFVAGAGIIEPNSESVAIGTQVPGIIASITVQLGSHVAAGDPLFTIDDRASQAALATAEAAVRVAQVQLDNASNEFKFVQNLPDKGILSIESFDQRRFARDICASQLDQARAQSQAARTDLAMHTVRAPFSGTILQLKIHLGEYAVVGSPVQPMIVFGNVDPLFVRTDVDENDAWRIRRDSRATGYLRGNRGISSSMRFVRFEPYVIPKVSLTGESTERIDTRVLQVIYAIEDPRIPVYVGQQMDVYIDGQDAGALLAH
jgi:HlyD family secretion protein